MCVCVLYESPTLPHSITEHPAGGCSHIWKLTHTHTLEHSLPHSLTHSITTSLNHYLTQSLPHYLTTSLPHYLTHSRMKKQEAKKEKGTPPLTLSPSEPGKPNSPGIPMKPCREERSGEESKSSDTWRQYDTKSGAPQVQR